MNRAATKDLTLILPTLSILPPELVELAASLLAQSHNKASSLKQEEEVARSYACAHLACERLKTRLNLPTITARPPCPPRIYKKLYAFLDSALAAQTPRKRAREPDEDASTPRSRRANASGTPAKRGRLASATSTPSKRQRVSGKNSAVRQDDLMYLLPAVRAVCEVLGSKAATPHVYTGVCSIFAERQDQAEGICEDQLPALTIGVALTALTKLGLRIPARPVQVAAERMLGFRDTLEKSGVHLDDDEPVDFLQQEATRLRQAHEKSWRQMEWYLNVEAQVADSEDEEDPQAQAGRSAAAEDDDLTAVTAHKPLSKSSKKRKVAQGDDDGRLKPGLGTMFCDAVDWLSDERRAAYEVWKRGIMARIKAMA